MTEPHVGDALFVIRQFDVNCLTLTKNILLKNNMTQVLDILTP
jgi:hypothetical protein